MVCRYLIFLHLIYNYIFSTQSNVRRKNQSKVCLNKVKTHLQARMQTCRVLGGTSETRLIKFLDKLVISPRSTLPRLIVLKI